MSLAARIQSCQRDSYTTGQGNCGYSRFDLPPLVVPPSVMTVSHNLKTMALNETIQEIDLQR